MKEQARCLVTGGAGFIGSHLTGLLLRQGAQVVVVDDFSSGDMANLADYRKYADEGMLHCVKADIRDYAHMARLVEGTDYVYHLACRNVRLSLAQPTIVHEVNATGTYNMLKASAKARVRRFLYCSSSEVNGTADMVPMPEEYHFKPETIYGASKLAGEYYTNVFYKSGWLDTVIVRPHNNYGPRAHYQGHMGEVIPRFILRALAGLPPQIYGDGAQTRDFTYVTETVEFMDKCMLAPHCSGMTLNICHGEEVSISRIAELVTELTQSAVQPQYLPGRPSDVLRLFGDPALLRATLGSSPQIDIRTGLKKTVDWYRATVPITAEVLASMDEKCWEQLPAEEWLN